MRFTVSPSQDAACRYLRCGIGDSNSEFDRLVIELGIAKEIGEQGLRRWLTAGIIVPSSVVSIPDEYFEAWRNFPECPTEFQGGYDLRWADYSDPIPFPVLGEPEWFLHPYDQADADPRIAAYKEHRVSFSTPIPETKKTARGSSYHNWAIHVPYWQAYRLYDAMKHGVVVGERRIFDEPEEYCRSFLANAAQFLELRQTWLASILRRWDGYRPCFEALSCFRTAVGLAAMLESHGGADWNTNMYEGGRMLAERLGTDATVLESYLPEVLLRLHHDWSDSRWPAPAPLLSHLQQDIFYFVLWLRILTGKTEEEYYSIFENPSRFSRGYSDLLQALPDEAKLARKMLPRALLLYLKDAPSGLFEGCDEERIRTLFSRMEERAPVAKAWVRNFHRLHEGLGRGGRLSFDDESTVDCASLMAVKTETLLADLWGIDTSKNTLRPILNAIITHLGKNRFSYSVGFHATAKDWAARTNSARSPADIDAFCASLPVDDGNRWFARQLLHFARARNFLVHRSSFSEADLDKQVSLMFTAMIQILLLFAMERDKDPMPARSEDCPANLECDTIMAKTENEI